MIHNNICPLKLVAGVSFIVKYNDNRTILGGRGGIQCDV